MQDWRQFLNPAPDESTNAFRILHGRAIGREDVRVDTFDGHWVVQTKTAGFPSQMSRAVEDGLARSAWWKRLDQEQDRKEAPQHMAGEEVSELFLAREGGALFRIDLSAGYSQGIFLDQRLNRRRVRERCSPGDRVLNTFSYTGAFSVVAALGGAVTTSLDLSRPYLDWGKENLRANGLDPDSHFFCRGDVGEWLPQFAKKGRTFHGVVLDPPSFSRNQKGKVFQVEKDFSGLSAAAARLIEPGGWMLCCTNHQALAPKKFRQAIVEGLREARRGSESIEMLPMPPEFEGDDYLKSVWVELR